MRHQRTAAWRAACSLVSIVACLLMASRESSAVASLQVEAPRILLDQPERIVEYQLDRLTRDQLINVERHDTDVRYRLVYRAFLRRDGVPMAIREEAVAGLVKLGATNRTVVLLDAL